jgi:hypothetical protein
MGPMSWFMTAERLGYRADQDRVLLSFEPPVTLHP